MVYQDQVDCLHHPDYFKLYHFAFIPYFNPGKANLYSFDNSFIIEHTSSYSPESYHKKGNYQSSPKN